MDQKQIKATEFRDDVLSGMSDSQVMTKYRITLIGLRKAVNKLVEAGLVTHAQVAGRLGHREDAVAVERYRILSRHHLLFPVSVYDARDLRIEGTLIDVSEKGLQIEGLRVKTGDLKSLAIRADEFHDIYPFVFDAMCLWAKTESDGTPIAGFEIVDISETGMTELRKLIGLLSFVS